MSYKRQTTRVSELFDYLAEQPDGVTIDDIATHHSVTVNHARDLIQGLRDVLGDSDTINVPCDPNPDDPNGRWLYRLVGTMDDVQAWAGNRIGDTERRIRTQFSVIASVAAGADPRSMDGRKARLMKKALGRLLEDLDELPSITDE